MGPYRNRKRDPSMIIKDVVIETDNGDTITLSMEKLEAFFASIQRMKQAADPEARERRKAEEDARDLELTRQRTLHQQAEIERMRCEQIIRHQEVEYRLHTDVNTVGGLEVAKPALVANTPHNRGSAA